MLHRTTRPVWKAEVSIKQFLTDEENLSSEQYRSIGTQIAAQLKQCSLFMEVVDTEHIIYDLEHAENQQDVNDQLDLVYDICDCQRIWCK